MWVLDQNNLNTDQVFTNRRAVLTEYRDNRFRFVLSDGNKLTAPILALGTGIQETLFSELRPFSSKTILLGDLFTQKAGRTCLIELEGYVEKLFVCLGGPIVLSPQHTYFYLGHWVNLTKPSSRIEALFGFTEAKMRHTCQMVEGSIGFILAAPSPGQNMLVVASTALSSGAMCVAMGIATGAFFWSLGTSFGWARLFELWPWTLNALRYVGGVYLLYLAYQGFKSSIKRDYSAISTGPPLRGFNAWLRGLVVTISNPNIILFWTSIVTLISTTSRASMIHIVCSIAVACAAIGVYGGYALLFSSSVTQKVYHHHRAKFELCFGFVFGALGVLLLLPPI